MAATIIPLIALFVILAVLGLVVGAMIADRRRLPAAPQTANPAAEMQRRREELRDALDRRPLGATLARGLWQDVIARPDGAGLIHEFHRDFCGHGLIRTEGGVMLCDVQDGGAYFGAAIALWPDEEAFVAFFAGQSDFSMSGWDPDEPIFFSDDDWYRNNQRLTRAKIEGYLARPS
ncbi:hypothetical protein LXM94_13340 [Rhizobium sp. TRM95111]|uniref:hypothetical protein n=1 Tax=Rhizobium alarense TaxID=2846851 RepID=UPI001F44DFEB|nr:hypothetical protein [Rhizobium alarense]MCF3640956.1 hypothetical protein [Rhizobium alarense]